MRERYYARLGRYMKAAGWTYDGEMWSHDGMGFATSDAMEAVALQHLWEYEENGNLRVMAEAMDGGG
jgi:hypothetical protein